MLPLRFSDPITGRDQLNHHAPSRNWYAEIYEPHAEKLLAQRKAMTRKRWLDVVSSKCIADDESWVRIMFTWNSKRVSYHVCQRQARLRKFEHDAAIACWLHGSGLIERQKRMTSYAFSPLLIPCIPQKLSSVVNALKEHGKVLDGNYLNLEYDTPEMRREWFQILEEDKSLTAESG